MCDNDFITVLIIMINTIMIATVNPDDNMQNINPVQLQHNAITHTMNALLCKTLGQWHAVV